MAPMLTKDQLSQYRETGFLIVTDSLLPEGEVCFVEERVDRLYDRSEARPSRRAIGPWRKASPPMARLHWLAALDSSLAHCQLVETCREIAATILGPKKIWCRFGAAVYKHPGAGSVDLHRDSAKSTLGTPNRSVHFWIPLNNHTANAGTLKFVPGSHIGAGFSADSPYVSECMAAVGDPLSVGNFSIHTPQTMHGSDANSSGQVRKALVLEFSTGASSAGRQIGVSLVGGLLSRH
jgi:phytanoyl-CoA hydroxylase